MKVEAVHRVGQLASGWLGEHTASIDWCEDNYAISRFIAEFWNTISNIPFILLGVYGIVSSFSKSTHGGFPASTKPADRSLPHPWRYALLHGSVAVIGIGSFIFHSTLKWHAQVMLDELPMVFAASLVLYTVMAAKPNGGEDVSSKGELMLKAGMTALPIAVSSAYLAYPDPLLHQVCYAGIMISCAVRCYGLYGAPQLTPAMVQQAKSLNRNGTFIFLLGFAIWNLDNIFCSQITAWRNTQPEWIAFLSQGHAWWHILTGLGGSRIGMGITYLTASIRYPGEVEVVHPSGLLPYVRRVPRALKSNGSNGVAVNGNGNDVKKLD